MTLKSLISATVLFVVKFSLDVIVPESTSNEIVNSIVRPLLDSLLGLSAVGALYGIRRKL